MPVVVGHLALTFLDQLSRETRGLAFSGPGRDGETYQPPVVLPSQASLFSVGFIANALIFLGTYQIYKTTDVASLAEGVNRWFRDLGYMHIYDFLGSHLLRFSDRTELRFPLMLGVVNLV